MEFCYKAFTPISAEQRENVIRKLNSLGLDAQSDDKDTQKAIDELEKGLTPEEVDVLTVMRSRRLVREDGFNMDSFVLNSVDGLKANMERGRLGLVKAEAVKLSKAQVGLTSFAAFSTFTAPVCRSSPSVSPKTQNSSWHLVPHASIYLLEAKRLTSIVFRCSLSITWRVRNPESCKRRCLPTTPKWTNS